MAPRAPGQKQGLQAIPLKVSGAWHSPLIAAAGRDMAAALAPLDFAAPPAACTQHTGEPTDDAQTLKTNS